MRINPSALLAAVALLATAAQADGLTARTVTVKVSTYDDPVVPYLDSEERSAIVGDGPEFTLGPVGNFAIDVVPVTLDLAANRIDLTYPDAPPGNFGIAAFNGYVIRFPVDCLLIKKAAFDTATTTLPLTAADLIVTPQSLAINVSGRDFDPSARIGVLVDVSDCPLS